MLAARIARCPGFRPLGCWSPFELCIRTLIGQQVTVVAARTLLKRLIARCGELTPAAVAGSDLSAIGMPGKRIAAIRGFAAAVARDEVRLDSRSWPDQIGRAHVEIQSLMRISYAVFCLKKKKN